MEIVDKPNELGNTNKVFKIIMQIMIFIALILYTYALYDTDKSIKLMIIRLLLSIFTSSIIVHYTWIIADTIRKWIMPELLVTSGAMDAFKKKIFWLYGPQFSASWMIALIFFGGFNFCLEIYFKNPISNIESSQNINLPTNSISSPSVSTDTTKNNEEVQRPQEESPSWNWLRTYNKFQNNPYSQNLGLLGNPFDQ